MLQPLVLPVNGSRGFKQVKEKKYPNFLLKGPSSFEREGKYPGSDSTQWGLGSWSAVLPPLEGENLYSNQHQLGQCQ